MIRNGHGDPSSILNKAVCTSQSAYTLEEGMNQTFLLAIGKILGLTGLSSLGMATSLGERKL